MDILYGSLEDEGTRVTNYRAKLNGSSWRGLLDSKLSEFQEAFDDDVCDALNLSKGSVEEIKLGSDMSAFTFDVRHRMSHKPSAVLRRLEEYNFPNTWKFYDSQGQPGSAADRAEGLIILEGVTDDNVTRDGNGHGDSLPPSGGSGQISLSSSTSSTLSIRKLNTRKTRFSSARESAMRLPRTREYKVAPASTTLTHHRLRFVVENCDRVSDKIREKVPEALNLDVCRALDISWKCVEDIKIDPDGNLVTFSVRHSPTMSWDDVRNIFTSYDFPYTWKVYEPDTPVEFESADSCSVSERMTEQFRNVTSASSVRYSNSPLPPFVRVAEPQNFVKESYTVSDAASLKVLHTAVGEGTVVTRHRVKFNGDNWDAVLERRRTAFEEAFDADVCDALDLPRGSVEEIKLGSDGLSIDFSVRHPVSLHKDEVDHFLATSEFPTMWKLYEPKKKALASVDMWSGEVHETPSFSASLPRGVTSPANAEFPSCLYSSGVVSKPAPSAHADIVSVSGNVCHLYRVGFVGGFWSAIIDKRFSEAVARFMRDAAVGEGLVPRSVERVVSLDSGNVVFSVWMEHAASLSQSGVCAALDSAPFPSMWKLYDDLINEGVVGRTTTLHRVGLVGAEWAHVTNAELVKEIFAQDVAEALHLSPDDININEYIVSDKLIIGFYVSHSHTLSEVDIDDMLANAPLSRVWGLCRFPGTHSWQTAHHKDSPGRGPGSLSYEDLVRGRRLRSLSPTPWSSRQPFDTPRDQRSSPQNRRFLGPIHGVVTPPARPHNTRDGRPRRPHQMNGRFPGHPSHPNLLPTAVSGVPVPGMFSQSSRLQVGSGQRRAPMMARAESVRASLPRVDLLKVGELLALMRQRQAKEEHVRLPPLVAGTRSYNDAGRGPARRHVGQR